MAGENHDQGQRNIGEGVPRKAPPKNPPKDQKVPPPDRQNADNIAPGHGRRIPDKD
jgi:hypothetical protein